MLDKITPAFSWGLIFIILCNLHNIYGKPFKKETPQLRNNKDKGPMDRIITVNQALNESFSHGDIVHVNHERNAIIDNNLKWPESIPYQIHMEYEFSHRELIEDVLRELSVRLCVHFSPRGNEDTYLLYKRHSGCSSAVGMNGGEQIVSIGAGCEDRGVILHETMHALGFWHEQSRYDRDDYVKIIWENIPDNKEHNFVKFTEDEITTLGEEYDYSSIMHYGPYAFSENGNPTIVALKSGAENMGQRDGLSETDLVKMRKLYACNIDVSGWSVWTEWSNCDKECQRFRRRFCEGKGYCNESVETQWTTCDKPCLVGRDTDCSSRVAGRAYASLSSPLYPYNYKFDVECLQTIVAEPDEIVRLQFEIIDVESQDGECWFDWIKVYDGKDSTYPLIGTYCGNKVPTLITSTYNTLTVVFYSDYSVSQRGYFADVYTSSDRAPIHMCHFEGSLNNCGWTNDPTADFDWKPNMGSTPSDDTGPSYDHTTGQDQGTYMFLETSSPAANGWKATLLTPSFNMTASSEGHCLEFWYNMYGENMGTLNVFVMNDGVKVSLVYMDNGNRGNDQWVKGEATIKSVDSSYKLAFEGIRSNGWKGDMAIDDVIIYPQPCEEEGSGFEIDLREERPQAQVQSWSSSIIDHQLRYRVNRDVGSKDEDIVQGDTVGSYLLKRVFSLMSNIWSYDQ